MGRTGVLRTAFIDGYTTATVREQDSETKTRQEEPARRDLEIDEPLLEPQRDARKFRWDALNLGGIFLIYLCMRIMTGSRPKLTDF